MRPRFGPLRALQYMFLRYVLRRRYLIARAREFSLRFRVRTEDDIGRHIFKRGIHEPSLTAYFRETLALRPGDVVLDVGANLGWFSLVLGRLAPPGARVFAFEPDPLNHELLSTNVRMNGARAVTPVRQAVSDRVGTATLNLYAHKNRGRHSLLPLHHGETTQVRTTTLDAFMADRKLADREVGLLKIDVEGHEYEVLKGAEGVLESCRTVVTEFAPTLMKRGGADPRRLLGFLLDRGFDPHLVEAGATRRVDPNHLLSSPDSVNIIWVRG